MEEVGQPVWETPTGYYEDRFHVLGEDCWSFFVGTLDEAEGFGEPDAYWNGIYCASCGGKVLSTSAS